MGDIDDNQPDMQKVLEEALKREIGGLLKKAGREFGSIIFKYILVFFVLFISISMLVISSILSKMTRDPSANFFKGQITERTPPVRCIHVAVRTNENIFQ